MTAVMMRLLLLTTCLAACRASAADIQYLPTDIVNIAVQKLETDISLQKVVLNKPIVLVNAQTQSEKLKQLNLQKLKETVPEGYQILNYDTVVYIIGGDERGLMYGVLDIRDQLRLNPQRKVFEEKLESPKFPFRAIKFNLPWSSYRQGESLQLHMETVKDLRYWEEFLDMMVDNRFNALTLWNLHPHTFMIQPKSFPEATQFTGKEFVEWQQFWRSLFKMAKNRGIETYIVNWNIIVSPQMTEAHDIANYKDDLEWHYGFTPADRSPLIVDYMRESITQVINEYPNLTGVGVSVGERMRMPVEEAMQWIKDTFVAGIRNANRKVKFIHRAPFHVEPEIARKFIESYTDLEQPIIMEFKFNWSHGHSSPNLSITHGGAVKDQYWNPPPSNYKMAWMMRNEDFLMLNWGNPEFIRKHIEVNGQDYSMGYFIGSETYIPAKEYRMKSTVDYPWKYAFEKQWEFYQMWGRLLYNPDLSDQFFIDQFELKYGKGVGEKMLKALSLSSRMPLALASFYQGTWDFTLYAEGFLNGGQMYRNYKEATKAFINVKEMISHPTLDARYLNIDEFVNRKINSITIKEEEVTPQSLALEMAENGQKVLQICDELEKLTPLNQAFFTIELTDMRAWAHLSLYFSSKLRGGIYLDEAIKTNDVALQKRAVVQLEKALSHWDDLIQVTSQQYQEVSLLHIKTTKFSWKLYRSQVYKDIEIAQEALSIKNR